MSVLVCGGRQLLTAFLSIENQFFVTSTQPGKKVTNLIGAALVERILSAATAGRRFKVVVIIPTIPCFAGELDEAAGIRMIMAQQYNSICRGGSSIMEQIRNAGVNPDEYISFYHLRGYDRINYDRTVIQRMEQESGVTFHEAQVAESRLHLGDHTKTSVVRIKNPVMDANATDEKGKRKPAQIAEVKLPATEQEARDLLHRFHSKAPRDPEVRDTIASNILEGQPSTATETWHGSEEDEKGEQSRYLRIESAR